MDERERRIGLNEAVFREVNEAVESISEETQVATFAVVCECGSLTCTQRIEVTHAEYEQLRSESHQFIVVPGHEIPDVEDVIERTRGYNLVRKSGPAAQVLAEKTDARTD
jgi:hypothetical protein